MSFHVPEASRWVRAPVGYGSSSADGNNGVFRLPSPAPGWLLLVVASDQEGWEHASVHAARQTGKATMRTPSWDEMCFIKDTFWDAGDVVMQLHPTRQEYVNEHPHTLHLWRPIGQTIPLPPRAMV